MRHYIFLGVFAICGKKKFWNNKTIKIVLLLLFLFFWGGILTQSSYFRLNIGQSKWQWIRQTILFEPQKTIDMAIIGSSHTMCGIRPNQISRAFNDAAVLNFGRYYQGRDADYFIIKEVNL